MRYPYTDEDIQRMSAAGRDVKNWTPSTPEERAEGPGTGQTDGNADSGRVHRRRLAVSPEHGAP